MLRFDEHTEPIELIYLGAAASQELVSLGLKLTHGKDIDRTKASD